MRKTLERMLVSAATIGVLGLGAVADSLRVIMKDDPALIAATSYYHPRWEKKNDVPCPDSNIKIDKFAYTGNSRGRTEVIAIGRDKDGKKFGVELSSYGDNDNGKISFQYLEDSPDLESDRGFLFSNRFDDGKLTKVLIAQPPRHFVKDYEEKELWSRAENDRDRWIKCLNFDHYKKQTEWRNARKFIEALPSTIDRSHYDITITHQDDEQSWISPQVVARLKEGHRDSISLIDIENSKWRRHLTIEWKINDQTGAETTFHAGFSEDDEGKLNIFRLGSDKLETFSRGIVEPVHYLGEVERPYSDEDKKAIFLAAEAINSSVRSALSSEVESSKKPEAKAEQK